MIKVNEYFDGSVKSLAYDSGGMKSSVGVIEKGDFEFGTSQHEIMEIIEGKLRVLLPGETEWRFYSKGDKFEVSAGCSFQVKAADPVSYLCKYR